MSRLDLPQHGNRTYVTHWRSGPWGTGVVYNDEKPGRVIGWWVRKINNKYLFYETKLEAYEVFVKRARGREIESMDSLRKSSPAALKREAP